VIADGFWLGGLCAVCKAVGDGSAPRSLQSCGGDGSAPRSLQSCPMPGLRGRLIHVCFICVASRSTRITPLSRYSVPSRATQQHVHSHVCSNVIGAIFADCVAQASVTEAIFADCVAQASVTGAIFADCVAQASVTGTIFTDCAEQRIVDKISLERYNKIRLSLKRYRIVGRVEH